MSAWHRPDVETAAVDILTGAVKPVAPASARQIVDGLLARGRDQRAAEVRQLAEQVETQAAEVDRLRAERDAFADRVDTLTAVAKSNKRHVRALAEQVAELEAQARIVRDDLTGLHVKHDDSDHCQHDGELYPCPTLRVLAGGDR